MNKSHQPRILSDGIGDEISLFAIVRRSRVMVLLVSLFLQIALSPFFASFTILELLINLGLIVAVVFTVADTRPHLIVGLALGIPGFILLVVSSIIGKTEVGWCGYFLVLILYLYVIRLFMRRIFQAKKVTMDTIGMALCTYVLIGALWMLFYIPVSALDPEAFRFVSEHGPGDPSSALTYFSYVTLTTLGYGDIIPTSELARSLAILEALTGTLFLAVLISRLVGTYSSSRKD